MSRFFRKVRVIFTAAPTYLAAAGTTIAIVAFEASKVLPSGWQDNAAQISGIAVGILGAAVTIIRRVTPVIFPADRGILPPGQ